MKIRYITISAGAIMGLAGKIAANLCDINLALALVGAGLFITVGSAILATYIDRREYEN